jgi:hypothetical protein
MDQRQHGIILMLKVLWLHIAAASSSTFKRLCIVSRAISSGISKKARELWSFIHDGVNLQLPQRARAPTH